MPAPPRLPPACSRPRLRPRPRAAQFVPYYGKNKVTYDTFAWRDLQEPALRGLLLPGVRAAPGPRGLLRGERVPEGLLRPEARDQLARSRSSSTRRTPSSSRPTSSRPSCPRACWPSPSPRAGRMVLPIDLPPGRAAGPHHPRADPRLRVRPHPAQHGPALGAAVGGRGARRLHARHLGPPRPDVGPRRRGHRADPAHLALRGVRRVSRTRAWSTTSATPPSSSSRPATARRASASSSTPSARTSWAAGWTTSTSRPSA